MGTAAEPAGLVDRGHCRFGLTYAVFSLCKVCFCEGWGENELPEIGVNTSTASSRTEVPLKRLWPIE